MIGVSGSGKSRFLAALYLGLLNAGLPATFIDPHGDTARLILAHLVAAGVYRGSHADDDPQSPYHRLIYLDLPAAERAGRFLPFNVLAARTTPTTLTNSVLDAMHRTWPSLAGGTAPRFDKLVQNGVKLLLSNGLPLPYLEQVITDKAFRDRLLAREPDADVVARWRSWYDGLRPAVQLEYADSTLSRIAALSFAPVLKYSLGQREMVLDFRRIMDVNQSTIINLALPDPEAKRLLGCLLTVTAEQGAMSRSELPAETRHGSHHVIIDEFSMFTATSEEALTTLLSQTRKYGMFLVMAHQTWSQASSRLKGALYNVGLEVVFKLGRLDAEYSAKVLGRVDPRSVSQRLDATTEGVGMGEQWERWVQAIQDLPQGRAFIRAPSLPTTTLTTRRVPYPSATAAELAAVEARYLELYFTAQRDIERQLAGMRADHTPPPPRTTRVAPVGHSPA